MSLDKRLKTILVSYAHKDALHKLNAYNEIEAIKQAFIDEGWGKIYTMDDEAATNLMTGPEFLARFEQECEDIGGKSKLAAEIVKAARRASGVDE